MRNYLDFGEAKAILCGIADWINREGKDNNPTISEVTFNRIANFLKSSLSEKDRNAVRLDDISKEGYTWLFKHSSEEKTKQECFNFLILDVDLFKLKNLILGDQKC